MSLEQRVVASSLAALAAAAALLVTYWSGRLAVADFCHRFGTPGGIVAAARWAPGNSAYRRRLAALEPAAARREIEAAIRLNPYDAAARIDFGLLAEHAGDLATAERSLLAAVSLDKTFLPRWTLANYYFRQDAEPEFWKWAREAAEMVHGDVTPLYSLCWRVQPDVAVILDRAVPPSPLGRARFLHFLVRAGHLDAAGPVVRELAPDVRPEDRYVFLDYCEHCIRQGRADEAVFTWNALVRRKIHGPYDELDPARGRSLTNGTFAAPVLSRGFDWRIHEAPGTGSRRAGPPAGLVLSLSGRQAGATVLVSQTAPVRPRQRYLLSYRCGVAGLGVVRGIRWRVADLAAPQPVLLDEELRCGAGEEATELPFQAGASGLVRLELRYARPPGQVRWSGELQLIEVALDLMVSTSG